MRLDLEFIDLRLDLPLYDLTTSLLVSNVFEKNIFYLRSFIITVAGFSQFHRGDHHLLLRVCVSLIYHKQFIKQNLFIKNKVPLKIKSPFLIHLVHSESVHE